MGLINNKALFILFLFLLIIDFSYAGSGFELKCTKCGFRDTLHYGGGYVGAVLANGYCYNCNKFVRLGYQKNPSPGGLDKETAEKQFIGYVYCPESGNRVLFSCPSCGKLVMEFLTGDAFELGDGRRPIFTIDGVKGQKKIFCPKCGKKTLIGDKPNLKWD